MPKSYKVIRRFPETKKNGKPHSAIRPLNVPRSRSVTKSDNIICTDEVIAPAPRPCTAIGFVYWNNRFTVGDEQDEPLPAISMFMFDAEPQMVLPRAKRKIADSIMGRRPRIWGRRSGLRVRKREGKKYL